MNLFSKLKTKSLIFFITWLMFPLVTFAIEPDPNCPLDYFYRGYDLVKGNPANDGTDPGWKGGILSEQSNKQCFVCSAAESCESNYEIYDMEAELDYYNSLTEKVNISEYSENILFSTAFTASAEYQHQQEDIFGMGLVNVQAEGSCQIFEGLRDRNCYDLVFLPGFLNAVAAFPTSTADPDWFDEARRFFTDYGTHVMSSGISLGARFNYEYIFTKANYEGLRAGEVDIDTAAEVTSEWYRTNGKSADYEKEEETEMRIAFDGAKESVDMITIGALPPSDISFGEWANNIDNPLPQAFRLSPISELFTPNFFPDDPQIEAKRAVMEAAYLLYCDSVPGCHVPKPPRIVHINEKKYDNLYATQNQLSVTCPANYQLISGGCKTEPIPSQELGWWLISSLKPEGNTYGCIVNKDSSNIQYQGLEVTANCLHDDYIDDIIITPCQGPIGYRASECIAQCPPGLNVTGGGCESNLPTDAFPWKVTRSTPIYNSANEWSGWSCRVAQMMGSTNYNRKAVGYAICAQYVDNTIVDQEIVSKSSGTNGYYMNGTIATCDVGYEVLSGGCITPSYDSWENQEWKIIETLPVNHNGWSCLAQYDGYGYPNQNIQTDALCAKFR